jgi:two-component system cell cycle response regulator CtrA
MDDRVRSLGLGADDYMTKPFHKDQLVARIHSIVTPLSRHAISVVEIGDLTLDLNEKTVQVCGNHVYLTAK